MQNSNDAALDPATRECVDRLGIRFELSGLPRIAGQVLGLMLVSAKPRSLAELAAVLEVSKASASSNARLLERMGLVQRMSVPGNRRDYYGVVDDLAARILEFRLGLMREMRDVLGLGLRTPAASDGVVHARLTDASESLTEAIEDLMARAARLKARRTQGNGGASRRTG